MELLSVVSNFFNSELASAVVVSVVALYLGDKFSKNAERRQEQIRRREKSAAIVDILAEWVYSSYTGNSNEKRWKLQTTYWKHILWLDKELLDLLLPTLAYKPGAAVSTNEIIVQARKIVLGLSEQDISADQLNNWLPTIVLDTESES